MQKILYSVGVALLFFVLGYISKPIKHSVVVVNDTIIVTNTITDSIFISKPVIKYKYLKVPDSIFFVDTVYIEKLFTENTYDRTFSDDSTYQANITSKVFNNEIQDEQFFIKVNQRTKYITKTKLIEAPQRKWSIGAGFWNDRSIGGAVGYSGEAFYINLANNLNFSDNQTVIQIHYRLK
jgi:hypothetical protein